jgi:hypothetical protein
MPRFLLLSLACLLIVHGSSHAQPPKASVASGLELCLAAAADYSPVYPTRVFPAGSTTEITAVVRLRKEESYKKLEAHWIAVDVPNTEANKVIGKMTLPVRGDRGAMHMRAGARGFPAGKYRVEVSADGAPWRTVDFSVAPIAPPPVKQPADLLPFKPGTVWRYAFVQEFAPGVKYELPAGEKLDADGRLRATLTKTAVANESLGLHIETRRNNRLVEEEWWQLTDSGLVVTKLKSDGQEQSFDPPGRLWPWPLKMPQRWTFKPAGAPFTQTFRMWGPVSVKGPEGEAPGYVFLMEQPSQPVALSVERHYLPGVGLVREVVVQARNGVMLTRWENVLTARP